MENIETGKLVLTLISGLCWTVVYIEGIRIGLRDRSYAIPFYALALNIGWELLYTYYTFQTTLSVQAIVNAIWFLCDLGILYTYLKYGRKYFPRYLPSSAFITWTMLILVTAMFVQYSFAREFGVRVGAGYSAFLQNLLMSILFIVMFVRRGSSEGQSLSIAINKWIGTLAPTIQYGILGDGGFPNGSFLILTAGIFCSIFDLIYIAMLTASRKQASNGNALVALVVVLLVCAPVVGQQTALDLHESERSDKITGGWIQQGKFEPNNPDIRITLNVPSFRLTLWQGEAEVQSYYVGVGLKDYPIYIGEREATEIIWNPPWIPPPSSWVGERKGVRPGEYIKPGDPRNPLGKMKIPLGDRYLIHQAAKTSDVGNLVSHGCVRMLRTDLYDLAEKIVAARGLPISRKRIEAAKRGRRTFVGKLDDPVPIDINYDTLVVEHRVLYIYPDVYDRGTNVPSRLRAELQSANVDVSTLSEKTLKQILAKAKRRGRFVVDVGSIEQGRALQDGRVLPLIPSRRRSDK
ncbi:MAG TPA: L,D-transpeptidase family protein [Pyrinomonadaceae bacterium]|nr:L,D-transpeptidase family protein [Pyrinomonadaceae bacterium]